MRVHCWIPTITVRGFEQQSCKMLGIFRKNTRASQPCHAASNSRRNISLLREPVNDIRALVNPMLILKENLAMLVWVWRLGVWCTGSRGWRHICRPRDQSCYAGSCVPIPFNHTFAWPPYSFSLSRLLCSSVSFFYCLSSLLVLFSLRHQLVTRWSCLVLPRSALPIAWAHKAPTFCCWLEISPSHQLRFLWSYVHHCAVAPMMIWLWVELKVLHAHLILGHSAPEILQLQKARLSQDSQLVFWCSKVQALQWRTPWALAQFESTIVSSGPSGHVLNGLWLSLSGWKLFWLSHYTNRTLFRTSSRLWNPIHHVEAVSSYQVIDGQCLIPSTDSPGSI